MTISAGTYTVGVGGNYSNMNNAFWDIAVVNPGIDLNRRLSGDLTFVIISDITESQSFDTSLDATAHNSLVQLNGFQLRITSSVPHGGNPNASWKWSAPSHFFTRVVGGVGSLFLDDIYCYPTNIASYAFSITYSDSTAFKFYMQKCLVYGGTSTSIGSGTIRFNFVMGSSAARTYLAEFCDNKFWGNEGAFVSLLNNAHVSELVVKWENCEFYNPDPVGVGFAAFSMPGGTASFNLNAASYVRNCVCWTGNPGQKAWNAYAKPTVWTTQSDHNARNTGTESNVPWAFDGLSAGATFHSLNPVDNDFLDLQHSSPLFTAGAASGLTFLVNPFPAPLPIGIYGPETPPPTDSGNCWMPTFLPGI